MVQDQKITLCKSSVVLERQTFETDNNVVLTHIMRLYDEIYFQIKGSDFSFELNVLKLIIPG